MHFLIKFWATIHLVIIKLSLKLLFQSFTHGKFTNLPKCLDVCEIFILGVLLKKSLTKTTQDIVKFLCVNLLYIKKTLHESCTNSLYEFVIIAAKMNSGYNLLL